MVGSRVPSSIRVLRILRWSAVLVSVVAITILLSRGESLPAELVAIGMTAICFLLRYMEHRNSAEK